MVKALAASSLMIAIWASTLSAEDRGTVRVRVEDFSGVPLRASASFIELGTKKLAAFVESTQATDLSATVPYGRYILKIEAPGFLTYERQLKVLGSAAYVRAALTVAAADETRVIGHYVYPFIRGSVQGNLPDKADLWAKLVPITGSEDNLMGAKIGKDGRFQFDGIDAGNYLLLILDGRRVIATEQVEGATNKVVTIKLP